MTMPLPTGQILRDRYRIVKLLGQGGFGAVYRAWDITLNTPCALKENFEISSAGQKQFLTEARILAGLRHPNLPRVTDYFILPGQGQYLVMDFVEGDDLRTLLDKKAASLDESQVSIWIEQVCRATDYLHTQTPPIIHRDIKPANIRITPRGQAMLVDFGLAKIYDASLQTTLGARAITPGYSPQEQYGLGSTDARSDIYALGATLYRLLTNTEPVESIHRTIGVTLPTPRTLNPDLSSEIEQVILKAMEPVPANRYPSISALLNDMISARTSETVAINPSGPSKAAPAQLPLTREAVDQAPASSTQMVSVTGMGAASASETSSTGSLPLQVTPRPKRRTWLWVAAGLSGILILAVISAVVFSSQFQSPATGEPESEEASLVLTGTVSSQETGETAAPAEVTGTAPPQPTFTRFSPALQGTALAAPASRISPDTAGDLELLGIVTLTNRKSELSWSEDSKLMIAAGNTGVQGYSVTDLEEERSLFAGTNVICLAFSPGQDVLAGGTLSGEVILWQTERGNIEQRFQFTENEFDITSDDRCSIAFSLDGKELYTTSTLEKEIKVWDPGSGKLKTSIKSTGFIKALALSPDGQTLAAGTSAGTISFYALLNDYKERLLQPNHASKISGLVYSPDGTTLAYIFEDGYFQNVRTDSLETGVSRTLGMGEGAGLTYSPDGSLLAVGSNADLLGVFLPDEMELVTSLSFKSLVNMQGTRMYLAFSPDGRYLAGTYKNYLYIWGIRVE